MKLVNDILQYIFAVIISIVIDNILFPLIIISAINLPERHFNAFLLALILGWGSVSLIVGLAPHGGEI